MKTEYQRPVKATLEVVLANGEAWEAVDSDLSRFGVERVDAVLNRIQSGLASALGGTHPGNTNLDSVWDLIKLVVTDPAKLDQADGKDLAREVSRINSLITLGKFHERNGEGA